MTRYTAMSAPQSPSDLSRTDFVALVTALLEENARLREEIKGLHAEIAELKRAQHRPAAPFSKGKRKKHPKKPGRRPGEGKFTNKPAPDPTEPAVVVPVDAETCPFCGGELEDDGFEDVTVTEIPPAPKPRVTPYRVHRKRCRRCGRRARGRHPDVAPDQSGATAHRLGPRAKAAALLLNFGMGVPLRRVPDIMKELLGVGVTQSALTQAALKEAARGAVGGTYNDLRDNVRNAPVTYTDDTGWRTGGEGSFLMGFDTDEETVFQIRPQHRNEEVREILPADYRGVMKTDRGKSYDARELEGVKQDKCVAHLIRNIREAQDAQTPGARSLSNNLLGVLRGGVALWKRHKASEVSLEEYIALGAPLKDRLEHLLRPRALADAANMRLLETIGWHADGGNVLRFLDDPRIEPTNNRAERALRPAVIARKVSQCSKNQKGADAYCAFKSALCTMRKKGMNQLEGLTSLLAGVNPFARAGPD